MKKTNKKLNQLSKRLHKKTQKPKIYQIYGIFNFKKKKMLYVSLDLEQTELEFGLGDYDDNTCGVISFTVKFV